MEPTTWTPERALAMLRDLNNDAIEGPAFLAKWGSEFDPEQVAMDALESAAAEIERQKARADGLAERIVARLGRVDRKESLEDALERLLASHAGMVAELAMAEQKAVDVSAEAYACLQVLVPDVKGPIGLLSLAAERRMANMQGELAKLKQQHPAPTEGPSDREIGDAVNAILTASEGWERAQAIVRAFITLGRRAGVRL